MLQRLLVLMVLCTYALSAQDYYFKKYQPFNADIPSPEEFLGYPIGQHHTRHDLMVAYFTKLAEVSDRATITEYGRTYEGRKLVMLTISTPENVRNLETIKQQHLNFVDVAQIS